MNGSHSHIGYIALSLILLIAGLAGGAVGGYYYAINQSLMMPPVDQTVPTGTDVNAGAAGTTNTNPLDTVKTNPFE